ncbi:MAG: HAMP domain-containing histidine kinase [Nocardioides sp.]|nr:HAMP domain-containing histidine kinase [Nocardioides sp.]
MDTGSSSIARPTRDLSWGDAGARALLHDIALDAAGRAGFRVCAIEVVRAQGLLEFVAIAGNDEAAEQMLGTGSRLEDMLLAIDEGKPFGHFTFVAEETYSQGVLDRLMDVACIPDIPLGESPDDWHPMDMLVAQVRDERGDLRALLYLDEPFGLKRLGADQLDALSDTLAMTLRSVLTVIEREEFAHHIRVIGATRRLARSSPARHDVAHLLREARLTLLDALSVDALEIHLFGAHEAGHDVLGLGLSPDVRRSLDAAAEKAWADQRVVIIEPGHVWGDPQLHTAHSAWFTQALSEAGFGAVVVAPVGVDDQLIGILMVARKAGSRRWTDGEGVAALELGHDLGRAIANAHATERERRLLEELRQLEEARHEFLQVVAHEINNPMTVISANAEYLLSFDELAQGGRERAGAILRGTERLGSLLEDLVLLSRVSDPEHPPMEAFDLSAPVDETYASMLAVAERAGVTLRLVGERDVFTIVGDPREVAGAIANLVDNAVKYSDPGGRISLELGHDDEGVTFTCRDEGLGISDLDQRRLFSPLFRSTNEEAIRRPGTGLGLGIVREIMSRHGGRVQIESSLGAGTTASLRFPPPSPG